MSVTLHPVTPGSDGSIFVHQIEGRPRLSIDVTYRIRSASPNETFVAVARRLPPPVAGRYSFRDLHAMLTRDDRAVFENARRIADARLRKQFEQKEISPLYFYRCIARMTQEQLAARSGSRQSFLSQIEKRKRPLTWKQAKKFAAALGVDPAKLMEEK